jgi:hypothetical protein
MHFFAFRGFTGSSIYETRGHQQRRSNMTYSLQTPGRNTADERRAMDRCIRDNIEAALLQSGEQVYANKCGYSDVYPYEVVRVVSAKTIEVRAMNAVRDPNWKPVFHAGGFSAHCSNQNEQRWVYESDTDAPVIRIRKSTKGWAKGTFTISAKPVRFYDYNF